MITQEPGPTGRGRNTAWWAGIANLFCKSYSAATVRMRILMLTSFPGWCDREKGVAGMIASQVMPFGDMHVMGQWGACEAAVYQNI